MCLATLVMSCVIKLVLHSWHLEEEKGTEGNVPVWLMEHFTDTVHKNIKKPGGNYGTVKHLAHQNNNITLLVILGQWSQST